MKLRYYSSQLFSVGAALNRFQLAFDFLFYTDLGFAHLRRFAFPLPVDAAGEADFSYFDPNGYLIGTLWWQVLIMDETGSIVGSSNSLIN